MIYFLFICLLLGLIFSYYLTGRNILSSWVISHIVYLISTFVVIINMDYFCTDISFRTVFVIMSSLLCWGIGELLSKRLFFNKKRIVYPNITNLKVISISRGTIIISAIIVLCYFISLYRQFNIIGGIMGGETFSEKYVLMRLYALSLDDATPILQIHINPLVKYGNILVQVIFYIFTYAFLFNYTFFKKRCWTFLVPIILYIPTLVLGTTRSAFISFFSFIAIIVFIMNKQANHAWLNHRNNIRIAKRGLIFVVSFMIVFMILGNIKSEGNFTFRTFKSFSSSYIGASIIGLDQYLESIPLGRSDYPGERTLDGVYSILKKMGLDLPTRQYHQSEFYWQNGSSNIYSSPYYLLIDFSYIGLYLSRIFWGLILGYALGRFMYGYNDINRSVSYTITSLLYYPVIMTAISESFGNMIGVYFLYIVCFLYICDRLIIKNH